MKASYDSYEEDATRCEEDEDNSTDEENEVCSAFMGLQPYQYEPEKEKVVTQMLAGSDCINENIAVEHEDEVQINRVGNNEWCECGNCSRDEKREIDCLCCQEVAAIDDKKFDGNFVLSTNLLNFIFEKI